MQHNEGKFTPMFPTASNYFPCRVLPMYLPSVWRLLICVCSVIQSATKGTSQIFAMFVCKALMALPGVVEHASEGGLCGSIVVAANCGNIKGKFVPVC